MAERAFTVLSTQKLDESCSYFLLSKITEQPIKVEWTCILCARLDTSVSGPYHHFHPCFPSLSCMTLNANGFEHYHMVCTCVLKGCVIKWSIPRSKCACREKGKMTGPSKDFSNVYWWMERERLWIDQTDGPETGSLIGRVVTLCTFPLINISFYGQWIFWIESLDLFQNKIMRYTRCQIIIHIM